MRACGHRNGPQPLGAPRTRGQRGASGVSQALTSTTSLSMRSLGAVMLVDAFKSVPPRGGRTTAATSTLIRNDRSDKHAHQKRPGRQARPVPDAHTKRARGIGPWPSRSLVSLRDSSCGPLRRRYSLPGEPGIANRLVKRAGYRAFGALVLPALVPPLGVILLADVRAPHDVPATPVAAAAHDLKSLV